MAASTSHDFQSSLRLRAAVGLFISSLSIEGVLMESFVGMYLLNNFPTVFHTLNIVALTMFGIFLVAIVGEMIYKKLNA
jgi:hypothetical protein